MLNFSAVCNELQVKDELVYCQRKCWAGGVLEKELPKECINGNACPYEKAYVPENGKLTQHKLLVNRLHQVYKTKNAAYGDSFGRTIEKYGKIAALTRMSDKWNRIETLFLNTDINPDEESVRDTLFDLANYCLMTIIELGLGEHEQ
jgi:hypothetical protein